MKIFITGITGLLGRFVAQQCITQGHEIVVLVRDRTINSSHFKFNLKIYYGDLLTIQSGDENLKDIACIINCAADTNMLSFSNSNQNTSNINGLLHLIDVAKKWNIKRFIHISSATTFLSGSNDNPGDESNRLKVKRSRLPYINTKIIGEEILLNEFKNNQFPVIILNPTFIMGPNDYKLTTAKLLLSVISKKMFFFPSGTKNIVDVRDVAKATVNAISLGENGNNYLLCNENLSYKEIFILARQYANSNVILFKTPYLIGMLIGLMGTLYEYLSRKSFAINHKTMNIAFKSYYFKADKAKSSLLFTARPAQETIKDCITWLRNEYLPIQPPKF